MASFVYQRKSLRFATGKGIKITTPDGPLEILGPAISGTDLPTLDGTESLGDVTQDGREATLALLTAQGWHADALTEFPKMWNTLARCVQCLADNRLATIP
jgi:hypothetical protein